MYWTHCTQRSHSRDAYNELGQSNDATYACVPVFVIFFEAKVLFSRRSILEMDWPDRNSVEVTSVEQGHDDVELPEPQQEISTLKDWFVYPQMRHPIKDGSEMRPGFDCGGWLIFYDIQRE